MGSFGAHMASQVEDYKRIVVAKDAEITQIKVERDEAERKFREESRIVDRVWRALGINDYASAHGNSIDEIVSALRVELDAARAALAGYQSPEAAFSLAMKAIEESQRANRAEAALAEVRAINARAPIARMSLRTCHGGKARVVLGSVSVDFNTDRLAEEWMARVNADVDARDAATRLALATEREACDDWRRAWNDGGGLDRVVRHDARRAAEKGTG